MGTLTSVVSSLLFGIGHNPDPHIPDPDPESHDYDPDLDPWANPSFSHEVCGFADVCWFNDVPVHARCCNVEVEQSWHVPFKYD